MGEIASAPLAAIDAEMLTNRDDYPAELLVKEIGIGGGGAGTRVDGLNEIDRRLRSWGVPMEGVRVLDGSGLSPTNRLTCGALLALVQRGRGGTIEASLPVAARSGTLADEFLESPMAAVLKAKTGTLGNPPVDLDPPATKALAGYVSTSTGATIEFSLVINTPNANESEVYAPLWDAFGDRLASYPSGPQPAELGPR
jgi:D-alanyl-D-alanine carboxypeptidase/D-alanyl-D-alanine-endopeptidase (penicillin-binding protein 4)